MFLKNDIVQKKKVTMNIIKAVYHTEKMKFKLILNQLTQK